MSDKTPDSTAPKRRQLDLEIQTMAKLDRLMAELPEAARLRVLDWLAARYDPADAAAASQAEPDPNDPRR